MHSGHNRLGMPMKSSETVYIGLAQRGMIRLRAWPGHCYGPFSGIMAVRKRILVPHFLEKDTSYLHLFKVCQMRHTAQALLYGTLCREFQSIARLSWMCGRMKSTMLAGWPDRMRSDGIVPILHHRHHHIRQFRYSNLGLKHRASILCFFSRGSALTCDVAPNDSRHAPIA